MAENKKRFENKVVLITGGAAGIGKVTVQTFAQEGATVVFTDLSEEHGKSLESKLRDEGMKALFVRSDVTRAEEAERLVKTIVERFGRLDIAVNNAGGVLGPDELGSALHDTLEEGWANNIALNLSAVFYGMKYQIRQMLEQCGGVIVNTGSIAGLTIDTSFTSASYSAAKAGMIHLSKWAAVKYAQDGVRVNVVAPAAVATEGTKAVLSEEIKAMLAGITPMNRMSDPEEIANAMLWLCSDEAHGITGVVLPLDGGLTAK